MKQDMQPVIDLLGRLREIYRALLTLSMEKKQAIIKCDTDLLGEITKKELATLRAINAIEKERQPIMAALAVALGVPEEGVTLRFLAERAQGGQRAQLEALQKDFDALLPQQNEISRQNRMLLETQLEYTDTMLNMMVGAEDPLNNYYGDDGRADGEQRKNAGLFDRQI